MQQARIGRRSVLTAGTGLAGLSTLAALSGCTAAVKPRPARAPQPDDLAVSRAIVQAQGLRASALARAGASGSSGGSTAKILESAAGDHAVHLAALGAPVPDRSASSSATGSSETSPSATSSSTAPGEPGDQVTAEWAGAREALRDAIGTESAGLAALLTRIAAARAVHADLLASALNRKTRPALPPAEALTTTPAVSDTSAPAAIVASPAASPATSATAPATAPSTPSDTPESTPDSTAPDTTTPDTTASPTALSAPQTPWLTVLDRLLAGEHAAVFAYPLVIAQLNGKDRDRAADLWAAHQAERNDLSAILVTGGALPAAAAAAYRVARPASAGAARRLAAGVELGLAALAGDAVAVANSAGQRTFGANNLVLSARRSAGWSGQSTALPGLPATPPATTPATPAPGTSAPSIT